MKTIKWSVGTERDAGDNTRGPLECLNGIIEYLGWELEGGGGAGNVASAFSRDTGGGNLTEPSLREIFRDRLKPWSEIAFWISKLDLQRELKEVLGSISQWQTLCNEVFERYFKSPTTSTFLISSDMSWTVGLWVFVILKEKWIVPPPFPKMLEVSRRSAWITLAAI